MRKKLKVLVLFDSAGSPPSDQNFKEELKGDGWETEVEVINNLKKLNYEVRILGIYDDVNLIIEEIKEHKPDVVFNLVEVFLGKASFDRNIPSILEMLQIPYTGSGPVGMMLCNNKAISKKILTFHRIKVPRFYVFQRGKRIWQPKKLRFPLIVKPLREEASTGIVQDSFVENEKELCERVSFTHQQLKMDAIAEEYIEGRELYVSILGSKKLMVFPLREIKFTQVNDNEHKIATYKAKWDTEYRKKWGIKNEFTGRLPSGILEKIEEICKKAYRVLQLQGYARFDIKLTPENEIFILEANANPSLAPDDEFALSAGKAGLSYQQFIQKILYFAFKRNR
jgi:D-alanine-D-alanine ligase